MRLITAHLMTIRWTRLHRHIHVCKDWRALSLSILAVDAGQKYDVRESNYMYMSESFQVATYSKCVAHGAVSSVALGHACQLNWILCNLQSDLSCTSNVSQNLPSVSMSITLCKLLRPSPVLLAVPYCLVGVIRQRPRVAL